jgi:nucleoside-diphosphate-sugar epimerase
LKICITGANGYVASALIPALLGKGHDIKAIDLEDIPLYFDVDCLQGDIRNTELMKKELKGMDAVIHLAAIVPPHPTLESQMEDINFRGTNKLALLCRDLGIFRFMFASSCSVYGSGENLTEWAIPKINGVTSHAPDTPYVSGKIRSENFVQSIRTDSFCPVIFRFATVFGVSAKVGWQSLFNDLFRQSFTNRTIKIKHSDAFRPFCHVKDIAQGIIKVLEMPADITSGQIYNIGGINATKKELVELFKEQIPDLKVENLGGNDKGYSVNFERIQETGFRLTKTLKDGISELKEYVECH